VSVLEEPDQPEVNRDEPVRRLPPAVEAALRQRVQSGKPRERPDPETVTPSLPTADGIGRPSFGATVISLLITLVLFAGINGWLFATGFLLCILAHEMGHFLAARWLGIPVSAPLFVPGLGAFVRLGRAVTSAWTNALIGIAGPIAGALAAAFCLAMHLATGMPLLRTLAFSGALLNFVNLAPLIPLDGGWISSAVAPRVWLIGIVVAVALLLTGQVRDAWVILFTVGMALISVPPIRQGLQKGHLTWEGQVPATPLQQSLISVGYLTLMGLLLWLMAHSHPA
jgi:membrane-associated protease RseP (regulator of RpoE activity)